MKKSFMIVLAALALAGTGSWAQTNAFPVKLRGLVAFPQINNTVGRLAVTEDGLVAVGNHLVLVLDLTNHEMRLDEVGANTNLVATLMASRRLAVLPDRSFAAGMRFSFNLPVQLGGVGVDGNLAVVGKVTPPTGVPKSINATVSGVLNDSVNGDDTNGDVTLKGKVSRGGTPFDGGPFGL